MPAPNLNCRIAHLTRVLSFGGVAAVAAAVLFPALPAEGAGPYRSFQVGLWSGGAYTDERTGAFSHCSAGVAYDGGINLFVVNTDGHGWWLGFTSPYWSLTPSASLPIKLQFDERPATEGVATITEGQLLLVPLPQESHLMDTFRHSSKISVAVQELSFSLSLTVTAGVLSRLVGCVRSSVAVDSAAPAATPPPPTAGPTLPQIPKSIVAPGPTELEEIKLATNFLLAAGLPNARLIEADKPAALAKFTAVWRSDDAAGAVRIIPPSPDVTAIGIASDLISVDPKLCKGNFAATRSSDPIAGGVVFRAALSCLEGEDDRTAQYLVVPRPHGGFVVFAIIGNATTRNRAAAGASPDPLQDLLGKAALQAVAPSG